jgi:hypothetical protein
MLQPIRSANFGKYQVEHLNRVTPLNTGSGSLDDRESIRRVLDTIVQTEGLHPADTGFRNLGLTDEGRALVIDGGALRPRHEIDGRQPQIYRVPPLAYPEGDRAKLLRSMGAPDAVRDAISKGAATRAAGQGYEVAGAPELLDKIRRLMGQEAAATTELRPATPIPGNINLNALFGGGSDFAMGMAPALPSSASRRSGTHPGSG